MRLLIRFCAHLFIRSVLSLTFKSEEIDARFDDRLYTPAAGEGNAVGIYGRLHWPGFTVDQPSDYEENEEFIGIEPKSEPHYASGRVDFFGGIPRMTTSYPGSKVAFFDLQKFWWGCSNTADTDGLPGWCTLEVNGFTRDGVIPVAQAVSFFTPEDDQQSMAMVECHLPSTFNSVNRVEFRVIATNPTFYIDNVQYMIYNVTEMGRGLGEVIHSSEISQSEFVLQVRGLQRIG